MSELPPNLYGQWRTQQEARLLLRERDSAHPPERFLQNLWLHQRLRRDDLCTLDGQPLRVLHPGFWNREPGPDFRAAVLQFGHDAPCSGDVEIDMLPSDWHAHRHDSNPAFSGVILRVVWEAQHKLPAGARLLEMQKYLDQPVSQLEFLGGIGATELWPETLRGACAEALAQFSDGQLAALLEQAALIRFQSKARDLETRARQAGWEQALWEGLFRALGYKHNTWPLQRAAELLPQLRGHAHGPLAWQALLLGVAGFLPDDLSDLPSSAAYARRLWDYWWRERDNFVELLLPKKVWHLQGRPANHPQRRLALAAYWVAGENIAARLDKWFAARQTPLPSTLLDCLQAPLDEYWSWHWTFSSPRLAKAQPLLGEPRVTDLAINVILPWFWSRARAGQNEALASAIEKAYLTWPQAQDNALLRLARNRLLGGRPGAHLKTAAHQQGLLQIVCDFCNHSDAICTDCAFPKLRAC